MVPPKPFAPPDTLAHNARSQRQPKQQAIFAWAESPFSRLYPLLLSSCKFLIELISAALDEDTGKLMEYRVHTKNPKYRKLYAKSYTKELGHLAQGMPGQVERPHHGHPGPAPGATRQSSDPTTAMRSQSPQRRATAYRPKPPSGTSTAPING